MAIELRWLEEEEELFAFTKSRSISPRQSVNSDAGDGKTITNFPDVQRKHAKSCNI